MQVVSAIEYYYKDLGPLRYGENFIGVLLFFVPRAIWPSKPIDTGEIVSSSLGYIYTNVSSPLTAESLLGFGLFGPALIFFILAIYISKIEVFARAYKNNTPTASSFFIYAISVGFIVIVLRGALNGVAPQFATAFLACFLMLFFKKYKFVRK